MGAKFILFPGDIKAVTHVFQEFKDAFGHP